MTKDQQTKLELLQLYFTGRMPRLTEYFTYDLDGVGRIVFDIDRAKALAAGTPRQIEVPRAWMAAAVQTYRYHEEPDWLAKVATVDVTVPGIAVCLWHPIEQHLAMTLIDGAHRMVRAWQDGMRFEAILLSPYQSYQCILLAPPIVQAVKDIVMQEGEKWEPSETPTP